MRRIIENRKGLRVLGHPLHTILNHFPLAFLFLVFPLELAGWLADSEWCWQLAFLASAAGLIAVVPAALTGLPDLLALPRESRIFSKGLLHMGAMVGSASVFAVELFLRGGMEAPSGLLLYACLAASGLGTLALALGGWLGGELVYGPGLGGSEGGETKAPAVQPRPQRP